MKGYDRQHRTLQLRQSIRLNQDVIKFSNKPNERDTARYMIKVLKGKIKELYL